MLPKSKSQTTKKAITSKRLTRAKQSFRNWKDFVLLKKQIIFLFIGIVITCAWGIFSTSISDASQHLNLLQMKDSLVMSNETYQFLSKCDSLNKINLLLLDKYHFDFNGAKGEMPFLMVSNATKRPCEMGIVNGCWLKETHGDPKDIIAIHFRYRNTGDIPVDNLSISLNGGFSATKRTFLAEGSLLVGDTIIQKGLVAVYLKEFTPLTILKGQGVWRHTPNYSHPNKIDEDSLVPPKSFFIGTVAPGEMGTVVCRLRIDNPQTLWSRIFSNK